MSRLEYITYRNSNKSDKNKGVINKYVLIVYFFVFFNSS